MLQYVNRLAERARQDDVLCHRIEYPDKAATRSRPRGNDVRLALVAGVRVKVPAIYGRSGPEWQARWTSSERTRSVSSVTSVGGRLAC